MFDLCQMMQGGSAFRSCSQVWVSIKPSWRAGVGYNTAKVLVPTADETRSGM